MTQDIALIERKRPQRALVIGCGAACPPWFEAARRIPGLEIVGIADLDEARAEQRAAQFGLTGAITAPNLYQLLARTQADIVFDIVTPDARPRLGSVEIHREWMTAVAR